MADLMKTDPEGAHSLALKMTRAAIENDLIPKHTDGAKTAKNVTSFYEEIYNYFVR